MTTPTTLLGLLSAGSASSTAVVLPEAGIRVTYAQLRDQVEAVPDPGARELAERAQVFEVLFRRSRCANPGRRRAFRSRRRDCLRGLALGLAVSSQEAGAARHNAGDISAKIYNDQNGAYWYSYYMGVNDQKSGQHLGGSAVFNLEDDVNYFGLDGKHNNNMRASYETFGKIATQN